MSALDKILHEPNVINIYPGEFAAAWKDYPTNNDIKAARAELAELRTRAEFEALRGLELYQENKRLREALKPFARIPCLENFDDDQSFETAVTAQDVRKARAALAEKEEEE